MRYRRALLLVELGADARPALSALTRVAPALERLVVAPWTPAPTFAWFSAEGLEPHEGAAALEELRALAAEAVSESVVEPVPDLGGKALSALGEAEALDLVVVASPSARSAFAAYELRRRRAVTTLFVPCEMPPGPVREVLCVALGQRARGAVRAFLHRHAEPSMHVTLLAPAALAEEELASLREVAGVDATVEGRIAGDLASMRGWLEERTPERPLHLLVFARLPAPILLGAPWPAPVLLLPPLAATGTFPERALDVPDLAWEAGPLRGRVDLASSVGDLPAVPDQELAFVGAGRVVATVPARAGQVELPAGLEVPSLGVFRTGGRPPPEPVAAIEQHLRIVRPGTRPVILFDSEIPDPLLRALAGLAGPPVPDPLAVRLRPTRSCRAIRERLRAVGLAARVLDARAVLDEGEALDLSEALDPVRLARVAARLRGAGFPVAAILHRGPVSPAVEGFAALSAPALALPPAPAGAPARSPALPPGPIPGNRVELELDNARARRWLLEAIAGSTASVHFQVYMAQDDAVGVQVEAVLAAAGARGVAVRVLVDSLHGLHGSFGAQNPLLTRLAQRPGVEVRAWRPITETPSLADLKQRDHRKLVVVDGRLALLGGRNLAHEYYAGFEEVALGADTDWRLVPWLDAGARVEGPAVAALSAAFLEAWVEAGGAPFAIPAPPPAGETTARVVVHRGLQDARTLDAYLELIDSARSHLYLVNGYPLMLELQHALLRALGRGVRVRALSGHLVPTHGGEVFPGAWAAARTAATELVHSRLDPLVAAGGEVSLLALEGLPGWASDLGVVQPYVHAKLLSADGRRCTVGSANLDVTSAYWESELVLVVEDAALARGLEARLDALLAGSIPMRRDDPGWQERARRRAWMRHWPGVLSA